MLVSVVSVLVCQNASKRLQEEQTCFQSAVCPFRLCHPHPPCLRPAPFLCQCWQNQTPDTHSQAKTKSFTTLDIVTFKVLGDL